MKDVVLMKNLPYLRIDVDPGLAQSVGPVPADTPELGYWSLSGLPDPLFVHEDTIDIAGYVVDELTFYPIAGDVQRAATSLGATEGFLQEWVLVCAAPIEPRQAVLTQLNMWNHLPGQLKGTTEFQNIIWGRGYTWTRNTNLLQNFAVQVHSTLLGSGEPTNGDKLYVYRIVRLISATAPGSVELPAGRLLLSGQVREEADYSQIMRMRRVYELQQELDVD